MFEERKKAGITEGIEPMDGVAWGNTGKAAERAVEEWWDLVNISGRGL